MSFGIRKLHLGGTIRCDAEAAVVEKMYEDAVCVAIY